MKRFSLAAAALAAGILSFVHLFGLEKAVFALLLGWAALEQANAGSGTGKKMAYAGIALGTLYIAVLAVIALAKGPALLQMISNMR